MPGPRDRRDHHLVLLALHPWRVGLQITERCAEIQRTPPPAPITQVIPRAASATVRAAIALTKARADRHHHRAVGLHINLLDHRLAEPQQPRPRPDAYASVAHVATVPLKRGF
jgi:hypothetical protein